MAKALDKSVVYLRQAEASHSTTMSGISDYHILYHNTEDLGRQVKGLLFQIQLEVELRKYILDLVREEKQAFTKEVLAYCLQVERWRTRKSGRDTYSIGQCI